MKARILLQVISILRALAPLAAKIIRDENNQLANEKDFQSIKVFGRCLELMAIDERNRLAVVTFLRCAAPLLGHQLKPQWDSKLVELSKFLEEQQHRQQSSAAAENMSEQTVEQRTLIWESRIVELLEESINLEGVAWALKLADELVVKRMTPSLSIFIAAVASNVSHARLLIELARSHSVNTTGHEYTCVFFLSTP